MEEKFKVGDVVTLNSGGPEMTVEAYSIDPMDLKKDGDVICSWFVDYKVSRDKFPQDALQYYHQ